VIAALLRIPRSEPRWLTRCSSVRPTAGGGSTSTAGRRVAG